MVKLIDADASATRYSWNSTSTTTPSDAAKIFSNDSVSSPLATALNSTSTSNKASKLSNAKPSQLLFQPLYFWLAKLKAAGCEAFEQLSQ